MAGGSVGRRRKRELHLYLREDLVEALEQVAADSDLSVSRVVEVLLGFYWEWNALAEKGRFMAKVYRHFRRTT
jgi:hypothetical protein